MAPNNEAKLEKPTKGTCFVIMPFSDPEGYEEGHFQRIYDYTFAPAIRAAGYEPHRIDENKVSSVIHSKMYKQLQSAPMVLCDLSSNNPNVLYELGIRHTFNKPAVLVQETGQKQIFDICAITVIKYHRSRLYEHVLDDQERITNAILDTAKDYQENEYESTAMGLFLRQHPRPTNEPDKADNDLKITKLSNLSERYIDSYDVPKSVSIIDDGGYVEGNNPHNNNSWHVNFYLSDMRKLVNAIKSYLDECGNENQPDCDKIAAWARKLEERYRKCIDFAPPEDLEIAADLLDKLIKLLDS